MSEPRHPEITVQLDGEDGNAFDIIGRCLKAMKRSGLSEDEQKTFLEEAKVGDYDDLLRTCLRWFDVV